MESRAERKKNSNQNSFKMEIKKNNKMSSILKMMAVVLTQ